MLGVEYIVQSQIFSVTQVLREVGDDIGLELTCIGGDPFLVTFTGHRATISATERTS
jgi:hypothetical protein